MRHAGKANAIMRRFAICLGLALTIIAAASEETGGKILIEDLLKSGWQIAGYTGAVDNWSTFILFAIRARRTSSNAARATT